MINPTGGEIREDSAGSGRFGAPRGIRWHDGQDQVVEPGEGVLAPISGTFTRIVYPYADDLKWLGLEILNEHVMCTVLYVEPIRELVGLQVRQGQTIGYAQDITKEYPGQGMKPHVHWRISMDPNLFL